MPIPNQGAMIRERFFQSGRLQECAKGPDFSYDKRARLYGLWKIPEIISFNPVLSSQEKMWKPEMGKQMITECPIKCTCYSSVSCRKLNNANDFSLPPPKKKKKRKLVVYSRMQLIIDLLWIYLQIRFSTFYLPIYTEPVTSDGFLHQLVH